jgi:hypothetical protein
MVDVCRWWPGISPLTIWDIPTRDWLLFARACDDLRQRQEAP